MPGPQKKKRKRNRHDPDRTRVAAQREEAKRRQREERRKAAATEERKEKWLTLLKRWGRYALIGTAVTVVALFLFKADPEVEGVEAPIEIRAIELAVDGVFDYGTSTPTSGEFLPGDPACGVFNEQITSEEAATAIYYGAVVLWYRPDLPAADLEALLATAGEYDSHVVVSPQEGLTEPIIATAWNRLMRYESTEGVAEFLDIYRKRAAGDGDCPTGF